MGGRGVAAFLTMRRKQARVQCIVRCSAASSGLGQDAAALAVVQVDGRGVLFRYRKLLEETTNQHQRHYSDQTCYWKPEDPEQIDSELLPYLVTKVLQGGVRLWFSHSMSNVIERA